MKLKYYILVLLLTFLLSLNSKGQNVKNIEIKKEIVECDTGISKIDKRMFIIINGHTTISIKEDSIYQGFTISKREVIPSYEDDMVYDIYYGLRNGFILELNINPYSGLIMQVNISYDNGTTYNFYKTN